MLELVLPLAATIGRPAVHAGAQAFAHMHASHVTRSPPPRMDPLRQPNYVTEAQQKLRIEGEGGDSPLVAVQSVVQPYVSTYTAQPERALGDFIGLFAFAIVGRLSHGEDVLNPFADLLTALPFLLAFFAVAKPLGAYEKVDDRPPDDPNATPSYREVLHTLGPSWAAGTTGGIALRSLSKFAPPPISFVLVTFVSTFIFLAGPRAFQTYQATGELPEIPDALRKWL